MCRAKAVKFFPSASLMVAKNHLALSETLGKNSFFDQVDGF